MTVDWTPPPRPVWLQRLNDHTTYAGAPLVSLDRHELLATAARSCGTDDFGGDEWRVHFDALMDALEAEWRPTTAGRLLTRTDLLGSLRSRLELTELWSRRPELLEAPVAAPLIIVGAARSGTSILHELLALDPGHAVPTAWKVHRPVAAAEGDDATVADARRSVDAVVRFWHDLQPEYEAMHHNHGDLPTECIYLTVPTFLSDNWQGTHTIPTYSMHLATADHVPVYGWHKKVLQTLQAREPPRRWILKAPSHLGTLRQLFAVYPDARVIQIHRDPARTLPSMFQLMGTLKWMRTDHVDLDGFVGPASAGIAHTQRRAIRDRADGTLPDERFHDLRYADLMADPVAAIRAAYDRFGWELTDTMAAAIGDYLAAKPRGAKGAHRYSLEDFGLTVDGVHEQYREYLDRFDIPAED